MTYELFKTRQEFWLSTIRNLLALICLGKSEIASAALTSVAASAVATASGYDPFVWVISGFGAAIVCVKKRARSRYDAIANGMISVMLGGLVSPEVALYVGNQFIHANVNPYPVAFLLSASWPWLAPKIVQKLFGDKT